MEVRIQTNIHRSTSQICDFTGHEKAGEKDVEWKEKSRRRKKGWRKERTGSPFTTGLLMNGPPELSFSHRDALQKFVNIFNFELHQSSSSQRVFLNSFASPKCGDALSFYASRKLSLGINVNSLRSRKHLRTV